MGIDGGRCESNGYCSGVASECASGRAYGPHSGNLSGRCIEPTSPSATEGEDMLPSTGAGSSSSTTLSTGSTGAVTTSDPTSPDVTTTPTTAATNGDDSSSSSSALDSSGGSESGMMVAGPCGAASVVALHSFSDGPLDPDSWNEQSIGSGSAEIVDGALTLSLDGAPQGPNFWWTQTSFPLPRSGSVVQELVQTPSPTSGPSIWLVVHSAPMEVYITAAAGDLETSVRYGTGPFETRSSIPYDPIAHRWVRLVYDETTARVDAEASPDAADWTLVNSIDAPEIDFASIEVGPGGGLNGPSTFSGTFAAVATIAICES